MGGAGGKTRMSGQTISTADDTAGDHPSSGLHTVVSYDIPDMPWLERVPRRILEDDERDLRWRFSSPKLASLAYSTGIGAALERAESFGYGALPCRRCGGRWKRRCRLRDGQEVVVEWRDGTGREPRRRGKRETYAMALARYRLEQCRRLRLVIVDRHPTDPAVRAAVDAAFAAKGEKTVTPAELREIFPALPDELTRPCSACGGIGVVPRRTARTGEITARPMGSSVRLGGREGLGADDLIEAIADSETGVTDGAAYVALAQLERYLEIESLLRDVAAVSPLARIALEAVYTPSEAIGQGRERARRPTGRAALRWLTPAERSGGSEHDIARQAAELEDHMGQVWNLVAWGACW